MATSSVSTTISNEERRWVVIGVCLTKVLTPALRNVLATEIPKWYHVLCQPPDEIDKQVYGPHKIQLNPSTTDLKYKNINNNHVIKSPRLYDYAVKDPLSLARLFVQPFMSKFTGFDQTMDISAVLSVIGEAAPLTRAAVHAKTVRSDIRNEWAHCNFANWTEAKFKAAFQSMETLLKNVNLSTEEEQKLCNELNDWKDKGFQLCFGQPVDMELLTLIQSRFDEVGEAVQTWTLQKNKMTTLLSNISDIQSNLNQEIHNLRIQINQLQICMKRKVDENQLVESNKRIKILEEKSTWELSRFHIKEEEKIPYIFSAPPRNRYFAGRTKEIQELKRILKVEETMNEKKVRVAAVCGMGGVGKTSLVSEYAHQMKDFYQGGVYWFSAEDDAFLDKTVNDVALRINALLGSFDLTLSNILKKISKLSDPTLFVLDCVDELKLSAKMMKFLSFPSQENIFGHFVIITRRNPNQLVNDVSVIEEDSCLELNCFQSQEATEFLLSRAEINSDENVESVAECLCEELGRLPLALEQAGACIKMLRCDLFSYLEQYKTERLRLLSQQPARPVSPGNESPHRLAVHTTWLINMEYVKKSTNGPAAVRFMNACSFFNGNEIEEELINVGKPEIEDNEYRSCLSSPLGRRQILRLLTDFSLFTYVSSQSIRTHRLVLELVKERLDPKSTAEAFFDAVRLLYHALFNCSSPSNHVSLDEINDREEDISFSDAPNNPSHFYMWSKLCIHGDHLRRNLENLLDKSVQLNEACFPEVAKILYECAVYLSANHRQEEAKRTLNFGYRVLDWSPLVRYETVIRSVSSNTLFPLRIPLPKLFQIFIIQYCKPLNAFEPLTDGYDPQDSGFAASGANDDRAFDRAAGDLDNVEESGSDGNTFSEESSNNEALITHPSAITLVQDCKHSFLLEKPASVSVTLEQYENTLREANDYIASHPNEWLGYAQKALALNGVNERSSPELVDETSAEIAAALAFYHNRDVFSRIPVFEEVFVDLKERIFVCDCVDELSDAIFSEEEETGVLKILVLGSEEYILDSNAANKPWNNCVLVGTRKDRSVSLKSDNDIELLKCMLANLSFRFDKGRLHCLPGSFVKTINCNFTSCFDNINMPAVETEGKLSAEQCSFSQSQNDGLLCTGRTGKAHVIDCSFFENMSNGLTVENGGMLIVKRSRIYNNVFVGFYLKKTASQCNVDNCYIHHNGGAGIKVRYSTNVTLKGNTVFGNDGSGINAMASQVDIKENDVFDNGEWGIWSRNDSSMNITMNRVSRNKAGGIRVADGVEGQDKPPSVIQQNKIYDNNGPGLAIMSFCEGQPPEFPNNETYNNKESGNATKLNLSIPYCSNCRKRRELSKCEKCFTTAYCCESCQNDHNSEHKKICSVLREKLSYLVTSTTKADYETETEEIEGPKDVGLNFSDPPPRDGVFVAKVHTANRDLGSYSVILHDRSLTHYVKFDSKIIDQLLREFGVLGEDKVIFKRLFFHCLFDENGKIRLFTNEFAEFQNW